MTLAIINVKLVMELNTISACLVLVGQTDSLSKTSVEKFVLLTNIRKQIQTPVKIATETV